MKDRIIGYIVLLLLSLAIVSVLSYALWVFAFPKETRIIAFNRIGNLRIDDPVLIKGVTVGKVISISKMSYTVLVCIEVSISIPLYKDYTIYSFDKGIMGDRVITIEPGIGQTSTINPSDTLQATFIPGVSEVLGSTWKLQKLIKSYNHYARSQLSESGGNTSFVSMFFTMITAIDTFTIKLNNIAIYLDKTVEKGIDSLRAITQTGLHISNKIVRTIPKKLHIVEETIDTMTTYVETVESFIASLKEIVMKLEETDFLDREGLRVLVRDLKEIQDIISHIKSGDVYFRQRWNIEF